MRLFGLLFRVGAPAFVPPPPSLFWRDTEDLTTGQRGQFTNAQMRGLVTLDRWRGERTV